MSPQMTQMRSHRWAAWTRGPRACRTSTPSLRLGLESHLLLRHPPRPRVWCQTSLRSHRWAAWTRSPRACRTSTPSLRLGLESHLLLHLHHSRDKCKHMYIQRRRARWAQNLNGSFGTDVGSVFSKVFFTKYHQVGVLPLLRSRRPQRRQRVLHRRHP